MHARISRRPLALVLTALGLLLSMSTRADAVTGVLEIPSNGSSQSGVGVVSGWLCDAQRVQVVINQGQPNESILEAAYGTARGDTAGTCGDSNNGFGVLFNWGLLGDGEHTAVGRARVNGAWETFGTATFKVTTLGARFLTGLQAQYVVPGLPDADSEIGLVWQQGAQNFRLAPLAAVTSGTQAAPPSSLAGVAAASLGVLENPSNGSFQSGIGVVSGWVCDADSVTVVVDEGKPGQSILETAYGTARGDTLAVCGDSNNGFGVLFNWGLLGDGQHTAVAKATKDGETSVVSSATFTVTTLGVRFRRGLSGGAALASFPDEQSAVIVEWQQGAQNLVITELADSHSPVEAGAVAQGLGIGSYVVRAEPDGDPPVEIDLRSPTGGFLGTITVTFDVATSDVVWTFVSHSEATAVLRSNIVPSDDGEFVLSRLDLEAVGRRLTERVRAEAEPSDGDLIVDMSLETPLPEGAQIPTLGEVHGTEELTAVLRRVEDGETVTTDQQMQGWFEQVGLQSFLVDAPATFVSAAFRDPNLDDALRARLGALEPIGAQAASQLATPAFFDDDDEFDPVKAERACAKVFGPESGLACCNVCTVFTPDIMPLGAFYSRSCSCCANLTGKKLQSLSKCVELLNSPIYSNARCRQEFTPKTPGFIMAADKFERSCVERCDEQLCRAHCESQGAPPPRGSETWCGFGVTCNCPVEDPVAFCEARHGETSCGNPSTEPNGAIIKCPVAVCGDLDLQRACPAHPDRAEVCEHFGDSQVGCENQRCSDDCRSCEPCECDPNGEGRGGCPTGKRCNRNCTCEAAPSCATDPVDREEAGRDWCSPGSDWCARGLECDGTSCRCKPRGTCGDGICDTAAGEQEVGNTRRCPQDCPVACGDGRCNVNAGESDPVRETYCAADCQQVQCCVDTGGCPSEEPFSCPGECCCCPAGAVCQQGGLDSPWTCGF